MSKICENRTTIVTGAGSGLGRAHALALASEGANVIVNDINYFTHKNNMITFFYFIY